MLKKTYIFLFLGIIVLTVIVAQVSITGSSVKAIKGASNVIYPVEINNSEFVVGFQLEINYSTNFLTFKSAEATSRMPSATIITDDNSPILKIAVLVNNETDKIQPGNGAVMNLIFDVDESATPNDYTFDLSDVIIVNISADSLQTEIFDGNFEILEPYNVTFLPPITNEENFTLQDGATLPLKFSVTDNTNFITDNSVLVRIFNSSLGIDHTYNATGEGNDYITIDGTEEQYITNIHTGISGLDMPEGHYDIEVTFDNYQKAEIGFELVDKSQGIGKGKKK